MVKVSTKTASDYDPPTPKYLLGVCLCVCTPILMCEDCLANVLTLGRGMCVPVLYSPALLAFLFYLAGQVYHYLFLETVPNFPSIDVLIISEMPLSLRYLCPKNIIDFKCQFLMVPLPRRFF